MSIELVVNGHFIDFKADVTSIRFVDEPWVLHGTYSETPGISRNYAIHYLTDKGKKWFFCFGVEWSYRNDPDEMRRMMINGLKAQYLYKVPEDERHPQLVALCK